MAKETYPKPRGNARPKPKLTLVPNTDNPEFGVTREAYEEQVFRRADHFNVVRYNSHNGSEITTVKSFPHALHLAHGKPRHLIYAVVSHTSEAFCISPKEYNRYAEIWLSLPRRAM